MRASSVAQTLLLVVAVGLLGAAVWRVLREPDGSQEAKDLIAILDRDGDGRIGPEEFARASTDVLPFQVMDMDASGSLDPWEVQAVIEYTSPLRASIAWNPRAL
jgi:Ca2+-binding EF-hand superfamily protein